MGKKTGCAFSHQLCQDRIQYCTRYIVIIKDPGRTYGRRRQYSGYYQAFL